MYPDPTIIACTSIVVTAVYILRTVGFILFEVSQSLAFDVVIERLTLYELHDVVGGAILVKYLQDLYDIGVLQSRQVLGLLSEALPVVRVEGVGGSLHGTPVLPAVVHFFHEELLDAYLYLYLLVLHQTSKAPAYCGLHLNAGRGKIGNAEATLSQGLADSIFATLQGATLI